MTKLKSILTTLWKILDNRLLYIAVILFLCILLSKGCERQRQLQKEVQQTSNTIDQIKFENKQLKLSDSTHAIEVKAVVYSSSKEIKQLRDSLAILMGEKSKLQKELGIIKYDATFKPKQLPPIVIDSFSQSERDFLKKLPCDSLKKLTDSNLLVVPAKLKPLETPYYAFKGTITRDGIIFDSTYPRIYSRPTIVFGESRRWFLGKWHIVAQIADENPYVEVANGKFITVKNKERKFGVTLGYGLMYDVSSKTFTNGPAIIIGYRF